ncbi:MAG: AMP-binding protein [Verrucomicrobia bacterium]|nr:AMP-binding protein [Verrucomicrobiota bacterium]
MERVLIRGDALSEDPATVVAQVFQTLTAGRTVVLLEPMVSAERELQWQSILDAQRHNSEPEIWLATGGTSGSLKLVRHTLQTLEAAAVGYMSRFPKPYKTLCCLPLWHVSGLMQAVRARCADGICQYVDYHSLLQGNRPFIDGKNWTISLVPTQLFRILEYPDLTTWLSSFDGIFVGGASLNEDLANRCRALSLPLIPCYGMTETAAMVTALDSDEFLAGRSGCGTPLPHVQVEIAENQRIQIASQSLALGYVPATSAWIPGKYLTQDRGFVDEFGSLQITGRCNRVINSGGEKVDAALLESWIKTAFPDIECWVGPYPIPSGVRNWSPFLPTCRRMVLRLTT